MGSNTFSQLIAICLIILLLAPGPALAQGPEPTPELPYNFEPMDYESEAPSEIGLDDLVSDPASINKMGSVVVTTWAMLDDFAGGAGVLGYLVVFLMGLWVLRWAAKYVYNRNTFKDETVKTSDDKEAGEKEADTSLGKQRTAFGKELERRKNLRF
jgi:hypothetical protein